MNWKEVDLTTKKGLRQLDQIISKRTGGSGNCVNCFYTSDVNQALDLVQGIADFHLLSFGDDWIASCFANHKTTAEWLGVHQQKLLQSGINYRPDQNAALVICIAWLEYMDNKEGI